MCLIIYSPNADLPARETFFYAAEQNPNGVGVMSERGVQRWIDQRATKRAWKYINKLARAGVPFGVHFRWTTHGETSLANCHPHTTALGAHIMHNGVIGATASRAKGAESDTAIYVREYLNEVRDFAPLVPLIGAHIGSGNKFLILDERAEFHLCNEDSGYWFEGLWYSNDYSLDDALVRKLEEAYPSSYVGYYMPQRMLPTSKRARGGYVESSHNWDNWEREQERELVSRDSIEHAMLAVYDDWFGIRDATIEDIRADLTYMTHSERTAFDQAVTDWLALYDVSEYDYSDRAVRV